MLTESIEDTLPADAPAYEQTQEEQVNNNALELVKFYGLAGGDWAEIGEAGLPLPRDSYYISSRFGWRQLSTGPDYHQGIDMATFGVVGVPIYAVKDGTCTVPAFDGDGYGNYVTIDHGNGLQTRYGYHCRCFAELLCGHYYRTEDSRSDSGQRRLRWNRLFDCWRQCGNARHRYQRREEPGHRPLHEVQLTGLAGRCLLAGHFYVFGTQYIACPKSEEARVQGGTRP